MAKRSFNKFQESIQKMTTKELRKLINKADKSKEETQNYMRCKK